MEYNSKKFTDKNDIIHVTWLSYKIANVLCPSSNIVFDVNIINLSARSLISENKDNNCDGLRLTFPEIATIYNL